MAILGFVSSYIYADKPISFVTSTFDITDSFALFGLEAIRFIGAAAVALLVGSILVKMGAVNKQMAHDTWISPIADFFKRYGVKLALVLLLLIGFTVFQILFLGLFPMYFIKI